MNHLILSIAVLFGWLVISTPKLLSAQTSQGTFIKVHFTNRGQVSFDNYDNNYRFNTISIANNRKVDTTIIKHINIDKPTIFTLILNWNPNGVVYKFIGFNQGDTISMELKDSTLAYTGNDKRMILFNKWYGVSNVKSAFPSSYPIDEYDYQKAMAENEKIDKQKQLITFEKGNKIDSQSIQILKNYIDLRYYYKLLDVKYPESASIVWKHPDVSKFDSADIKNNLLLSVRSKESRFILFDLIYYYGYLNKIHGKTILQGIPFLNSRYYKTKILDALIFEILGNKIKSLDERRQILNSLKDYMLDSKDEMITLKKEPGISKEALNVKLVGYDGKTTLFEKVFKGDQKLVVLDFWASWCAPCIAEIPKMKEANTKLSKEIKFISISADKDSKKWIEGCNKHNIKANSFLLTDISTNELLKFFGITGVPTFVVMTNKGEILDRSFLRPSEAMFVVTLQKMLEKL